MLSYRSLCSEYFDSYYLEKMQYLSKIFQIFPVRTVPKYFYFFNRRPNQTQFLTKERSARVNLLIKNTSRIFLAQCQFSDLELA